MSKMTIGLKKWYVSFLGKTKKNILEILFDYFLLFLSFIYGGLIAFRNLLYDQEILRSFASSKKVISIGNLSWAGSGKTTLTIALFDKLSDKFKIAILRRGYGGDEEKLIKEYTKDVFSSPNRAALIKNLSQSFDVFIIDDGFQYRKLKRDLNIVVMGAREFKGNPKLIPANFFREPLSSLKRAQIVILNYREELDDPQKIKSFLLSKFGHLKIHLAGYKLKRIVDLDNNEYTADYFKGKKLAAVSAIGYPQGFFNKLKELNLNIEREIVYPDHYEFSKKQFQSLAENLLKEGISDIIVTAKDKYHFPKGEKKLNIFVMEIDIQIENMIEFLKEIESKLK